VVLISGVEFHQARRTRKFDVKSVFQFGLDKTMGRKQVDYAGKRFGKLVAIEATGEMKHGHAVWLMKCDCGNFHECRPTQGTSCGCVRTESSRVRLAELRIAATNPNASGYHNYGGRGIKFLFTSFNAFLTEVGIRTKGTSIDRIDNDGHYESGNVRWATKAQQRSNQRNA
jgi:hypothetical protein